MTNIHFFKWIVTKKLVKTDPNKILTLFNLFILRHLLRLSATFNIFYLTFVLYLEFLCTGFVLSFVFIKWYGLLSKVIKFLISKISYNYFFIYQKLSNLVNLN